MTDISNNNRLEGNKGNSNSIGTVLQRAMMGNVLSFIKLTVVGATAAASFDITDPDLLANGTVTLEGIALEDGEGLPALGSLGTLRVTGATTGTFVGTYILTDEGGTGVTAATSTVVGIAEISDDGTTITFPTADVTGFILQYMPRSAVDMSAAYPSS